MRSELVIDWILDQIGWLVLKLVFLSCALFLGDSVWYFCREFHDEQQKVKKKEGRKMLASVTLIVM